MRGVLQRLGRFTAWLTSLFSRRRPDSGGDENPLGVSEAPEPAGPEGPTWPPGMEGHRAPEDERFVSADDPVLAALLNEQSILADRDTALIGSAVALAAVGAAVVGVLLLQFPDLCSSIPTVPGRHNHVEGCIEDSQEWLFLLAPLPVAALTSILIYIFINNSFNAQMYHRVEKAIRDRLDYMLPTDEARRDFAEVGLPESNSLVGLMFSAHKAPTLRMYRLLGSISIVAVIGVLLFPLVELMLGLSRPIVLGIVGIYGSLAVLYLAGVRRMLETRRMMRDVTAARDWLADRPVRRRVERWKAFSYLTLPRRVEFLLKPWAGLLVMLIARLIDGGAWSGWPWAIGSYVAFELLLYQGRYMFNDARDYVFDSAHDAADERSRLPYLGRFTRPIAFGVGTMKMIAFGIVVVLAPESHRESLIWAAIAVVALMVVYDTSSDEIRARVRLVGGDQPGDAVQGRTPKVYDVGRLPSWPVALRLVLVAPGYGIRGALGLAIALDGEPSAQAVGLVLVALAAVEASNVALGWILEASRSVHTLSRLPKEAATRKADPNRAKLPSTPLYGPSLCPSPHIARLARSAGLLTPEHEYRESLPANLADVQVLMETDEVNGWKPWNAAAIISLAAAAGLGLSLADDFRSVDETVLALTIAAGLVLAAAPLIALRTGSKGDYASAVSAVLVSALSVGVALQQDLPHALWAWLPAVLVTGLVIGTRLSTYNSYITLAKQLGGAISSVAIFTATSVTRSLRFLASLVIGRSFRADPRPQPSPLVPVSELSEAVAWLKTHGREGTLLVDLENTLMGYQREERLDGEALRTVVEESGFEIILVSNADWAESHYRSFEGLNVVAPARKPFTGLDKLGEDPVGVMGDQVLTDGLLARRLGVPFFHVATVPDREPLWPKTMRVVGSAVRRLVWRQPTR